MPQVSKFHIGLFVVALIAGTALVVLRQGPDTVASPPPAQTISEAAPPAADTALPVVPANAVIKDPLGTQNPAGEIELGDPNAPVTIVEYSSLTCPHCAAFHANTLPDLKKKYIDKGLVKIQFRPFPFDPFATAGAMLAQCVAPAQRVAFLDVLFLRQSTWARSEKPMEQLQQLSRQAGLSEEDFVVCLKDESILQAIRDMQKGAAENLGVRSTPTFFINGKKLEGNAPLETFEKRIEPLLPADRGQ